MSRYDQIALVISIFQPKTIVETGTWKGYNAIRMIMTAAKYNENIEYTGYDFFEDANDQTDTEEFNVKEHPTMAGAKEKILRKCEYAQVELYKGDTKDTLGPTAADFAYIDGGHSIETIRHDYEMLKGSKVILFDDYYMPDEDGKCPDISKYGCNEVVKGLPHIVLPSKDKIKGGGVTHLVLCMKNRR